jgi:hypothetical protein
VSGTFQFQEAAFVNYQALAVGKPLEPAGSKACPTADGVAQVFQPASERNFPVPGAGFVNYQVLAVGKPPEPAGSKACPTKKEPLRRAALVKNKPKSN